MPEQATLFEQHVLPLFELNRADWLDQARTVARMLGARGNTVTIDQVRERCPPPSGIDPRVMGAVFTRSEWTNCGYVKGDRATSHGRPIATFRLKGL
jgi:hypothetical protein